MEHGFTKIWNWRHGPLKVLQNNHDNALRLLYLVEYSVKK